MESLYNGKNGEIPPPKKFTKRLISGITAFVMTFFAVVQTGICSKTVKAADENATKRVYGDLNEDGTINIFDLMHLKNILLKSEKDNKMLKFADVDGDGETSFKDISEMVRYLMSEIGIFKPELELDSDKDGLCDYFEQILGTDLQNPDSDDDGLSDFEEVFISFTDPLKEDTDGTGKKDGLKDFDDDGLCNADEIKNNTDIFSDDTDRDGIKDAEEVEKGTKSDSGDSDDDGISDLGEMKLGLDPNLSSTDGKIPDSKRYFDQTMSEEKLAEVNDDNRLYTLSVSAHMAGYLDDIMNVKVSTASNALANRATYGTIIDVDFKDTVCDTAEMEYTMSFHLDTEDNPEDYMVFYYSEEDYLLVPFETSYDGKNISMTYNQKGTFCLVNINALDFSSEEGYDTEEEILSGGNAVNNIAYGLNANETKEELSYAFYFKITNFDIKNWDSRLYYLMVNSAEKITSKDKKIKAHVVFYGTCSLGSYYVDYNCDCVQDFKDIYILASKFFSRNITEPFKALSEYNAITSDSSIAINSKTRPSVNYGSPSKKSLPVIFDFGGSKSSYSVYLDGNEWNIFGSKYSDNDSVNIFRYMAASPSSAETVYSIILNNHASAPHYRRASYFGFVAVSSKITEEMIIAYKNSNGVIKSGIYTDDESIDVLDKIDMSLIKIENGKVVYPTYGNAVSKNSKTKKGSESLTEKKKISIDEFNQTYYTPFKSSPYTKDYDGDGLFDDEDPDPLNVFDNRFELVNKYDADPYELFPKNVLADYEIAYENWYNSEYQQAKRNNDTEKMKEIKENNIKDYVGINIIKLLGLDLGTSGENLTTFLDNAVLKNAVVDLGEESADYFIGNSRGARYGFYTCMNLFFECAEKSIMPGHSSAISTKTDPNYLLPGSIVCSPDEKDSDTIFKLLKNIPHTIDEFNILVTISAFQNAIVSKDVSCFMNDGNTYYNAKVRFYILDLYNYTGEGFAGPAEKIGFGEPYLYSAFKEMNITWKKGDRLPQYSNFYDVNLNEFNSLNKPKIDGIDFNQNFNVCIIA